VLSNSIFIVHCSIYILGFCYWIWRLLIYCQWYFRRIHLCYKCNTNSNIFLSFSTNNCCHQICFIWKSCRVIYSFVCLIPSLTLPSLALSLSHLLSSLSHCSLCSISFSFSFSHSFSHSLALSRFLSHSLFSFFIYRTCGMYQIGQCNYGSSKLVLENACLFKNQCQVSLNTQTFGGYLSTCSQSDLYLNAEVVCSN
jgi:hypothetical protein